jgi:hypothetical protein
MATEKPERMKSVSRNIYSELARNHNTSVRVVDRAIRCAIDSAHKKTINSDSPLQSIYMSMTNKRRPNNALIISFLADMAIRRCRT